MKKRKVKSSNLRSVEYDSKKLVLTIVFQNGSKYDYYGVPLITVQGLMAAKSKGKYFNEHIRSVFTYSQVVEQA